MSEAPSTPTAAAGNPGLRFDIVAGLTAAAVVLPKAMAYATVAGLPVAVGLYTAFVPMIIYALLGTSRVLSVSSTTTLAILAGTQLGLVVPDGDPAQLITAVATLTAMTGAILMLASLLRLGFVANFISTPVLTGFKAGIGFVILLDQIPKLFGIHITKQGFFHDILSVVQHLPDTSMITLAVAVATLVVLIGMERLWPHSPAPLVAVGGGIAAAWLFGLEGQGVSIVGLIPQGFPSLTLPSLSLVEATAAGCDRYCLDEFYRIDCRRACLCRSLQTRRSTPTANWSPRARPTWAAPCSAPCRPAGAPRRPPWCGQPADKRKSPPWSRRAQQSPPCCSWHRCSACLPHATLAAVVIVYSMGLIQPAEFAAIRKVRTMEFRWAAAAFFGVLIFGTLKGIVVAIIVSLIGLASQVANPRVYVMGRKRGTDVLRPTSPEHPDDETFEGLLILHPEGRLFFVNAQAVADQIKALVAQHQPRVVVLDMSGVMDIEYSALQMIMEGEKRVRVQGLSLWLAGLNPSVLETVRHAGLADTLGRERMLFNAHTAIERFLENRKVS